MQTFSNMYQLNFNGFPVAIKNEGIFSEITR